MPLSDHEQKLLDEMERQLFADDPRLARAFHESTRPRRDRRRILLGVIGVVAGLALLVLAVAIDAIWLGVLAFLLMVAGGVWAATTPAVAPEGQREAVAAARQAAGRSGTGAKAPSSDFMRRMEERWDRRSDPD